MLKKFVHKANDFAKSSKLRKNNEDFVNYSEVDEEGDSFYAEPPRRPNESNYDNYHSSRLANDYPSSYSQSNYNYYNNNPNYKYGDAQPLLATLETHS